MANIYVIEQELQEIFDNIEANGGEVDDEILEQLTIRQEEFANKVDDYTKVILNLNADVAAIKVEKARLDALKSSKEKTITRLNKIIIDAIERFGDTTKTGIKFVDCGTSKISIKNTKNFIVDEVKKDDVIDSIVAYVDFLRATKQEDSIDSLGIDDINECVRKRQPVFEDEEPFLDMTEDDMKALGLSIKVDLALGDLSKTGLFKILNDAIGSRTKYTITPTFNKNVAKAAIKEGKMITLGNEEINKTITIK